MRILELIQDGTAALRLAAILAGAAMLWLLWVARSEGSAWKDRVHHQAAALKRIALHAERRRADRLANGALAELERLRHIGAI